MNHLHELAAVLPGRNLRTVLFPNNGHRLLLEQARQAVPNAVCFDQGDLPKLLCSVEVIPELTRMPFDTTWFEGTASPSHIVGVLANRTPEGDVLLSGFVRDPDGWAFIWAAGGKEGDPDSFRLTATPETQAAATWAYRAVLAFCSAINCTNVTREEHKPSEKLQRARAKRGKQPLFSYWTLQLSGPRSSGERAGLGGSHASPRVHLRRGHPRQYAPGKWTWVQPCAVGDRAVGMVHKDYALNNY